MESKYFLQIIFIVPCLTWAVTAVSPSFWRVRQMVEERRWERIQEELKQDTTLYWHPKQISSSTAPEEKFITQPLDHFDPSQEGTYEQRYFVNNQYWTSSGPVFLFIGGEGSISQFDVMGGEHVELAKKYGAMLFAVEHRYYGASINMDGLMLKNMRFLSSQQALADLASFYDFAMKNYSLTSANTWICFGGSYPGALSAWFRIKYPHIVYGAIASSAPVRAQLNFEGYNDVVAASLADPVVNGSQLCLTNVQNAFETINNMLDAKVFAKLETDFMSCNDISSQYDTVQFVGNVAGTIQGIVQYNEELQFQNITTLCAYMTDSSRDPYSNLVTYSQKVLSMSGMNCTDNSWAGFMVQLSNTTVDKAAFGVGLRQWIYQTCTQFGYYQTCDSNTTCPFYSPYLDLDSNLIICEQIFEVSEEETRKMVDFTNDYYGSDQPKGSRIVFVNGSVDPWHYLSVLKNQTMSEIAVFINGTSHCQNMNSNRPGDSPALLAARMEIDTIIGQWLQAA